MADKTIAIKVDLKGTETQKKKKHGFATTNLMRNTLTILLW